MISVAHTFKLYELVNKYFQNDDDSKAFIAEIDNFISAKPDVYHELATKSDLKKLEDATEKLQLATKTDLKKLEAAAEKFQVDLNRLETATEKFQADTKSDLKRLETDIREVKAEVNKLEIKMGEGFKDILKWIIAIMLGFASLIITFIKILS